MGIGFCVVCRGPGAHSQRYSSVLQCKPDGSVIRPYYAVLLQRNGAGSRTRPSGATDIAVVERVGLNVAD